MVNLEKVSYSRAFIIGNVNGDYHKLIDILYEQKFSNNDILIATGDFTQSDNLKSIDTLLFFMNNENTVGLLGKNEFDLLQLLQEEKIDQLPLWVKNYPNLEEIAQYLINLPTIVQLNDNYYIVNRGIETGKDIKSQNPEVFYTITDYDKDSRYYQGNYGEYSWYNLEQQDEIIFSGLDAGNVEVNAGYCLYSDAEKNKPLKCLIHDKDSDSFIIVESVGNLLNGKQAAYGFDDEEAENMTKELMKNLENVKNMKKNINFNPERYNKPPKIKLRDTSKDQQNIMQNAGVGLPSATKPKITRRKTPYDLGGTKMPSATKPVDETQNIIDEGYDAIKTNPAIYEKDKTKKVLDKNKKIIDEQKKLMEEGLPQISPDTSEKPTITPENITPEEYKEEVETPEGIKTEIKQLGETPNIFNDYYIPDDYMSKGDINATGIRIDNSVSAIYYLSTLGYIDASWNTNEGSTLQKCPSGICKANASNSYPSLLQMIADAKAHKSSHGYSWPPATIYQYSHPNCNCKFEIKKPNSYINIPNNAPGLPMNVSNEILIEYKQKLFEILPNTFTVSPQTIAPDKPFAIAFLNNEMDRTKTAKVENWFEEIKPIKIIKPAIVDVGLGMRHPISEGDVGFILKYNDKKAQIFSLENYRVFTVPMDILQEVYLKKSDNQEKKKGRFILTEDGMIGLLYDIEDDDFIIYNPEVGSTMKINKIQMLEHS